jgi:hypothetical protein
MLFEARAARKQLKTLKFEKVKTVFYLLRVFQLVSKGTRVSRLLCHFQSKTQRVQELPIDSFQSQVNLFFVRDSWPEATSLFLIP